MLAGPVENMVSVHLFCAKKKVMRTQDSTLQPCLWRILSAKCSPAPGLSIQTFFVAIIQQLALLATAAWRMGVGDLADSTQLAAVHVKAADAYAISMIATSMNAESDLGEPAVEAAVVDQPEELDDGGEDAVLEQDEPEAVEEAAPPPEAPQPAAPTAEERQEAERDRDRKRFEARRAGRMYFVRHPRAPEDPGAPGRSARARRPLVRAQAGAEHAGAQGSCTPRAWSTSWRHTRCRRAC
jgi:type IV secretory pathway VirB10-like protein